MKTENFPLDFNDIITIHDVTIQLRVFGLGRTGCVRDDIDLQSEANRTIMTANEISSGNGLPYACRGEICPVLVKKSG